MKFWVIQMGEMLPGIDGDLRAFRYQLISETLADRGHKVIRWTSTFNHMRKAFRFHKDTTIHFRPNLDVQLLHGTPGYKKNVSLRRVIQQKRVAQLLERHMQHFERPDLILAGIPVPELAAVAVRFGRRRGIPVVLDVQDMWPDIYLTALPNWSRALARCVLHLEFLRSRKMLAGADSLTAVSATYLNWALKRAGLKPSEAHRVFPLGFPSVDFPDNRREFRLEARRSLNLDQDAIIGVFLGTFGTSYDLETVVEAAKLLKQEEERYVIVLAGSGNQYPKIARLAEGVKCIRLAGWVEQQQAHLYLGAADFGIAAYAEEALQSLPYKPFEYMAYGLPIVSSLNGEMSHIIEEHQIGRDYPAHDSNRLAKVISEIGKDWMGREEMALRSRELFQREYRSDKIYEELAGHLEKIVLARRELNQPLAGEWSN